MYICMYVCMYVCMLFWKRSSVCMYVYYFGKEAGLHKTYSMSRIEIPKLSLLQMQAIRIP